jgi:hypothetical protein
LTQKRNNKKLLYGVGINDSSHQTQKEGIGYICPVFMKWRNMLQRCYSSSGYRDCTVCEEWKRFSVFELWVDSLHIDKSKLNKLHLDKDLLSKGNKHYSPETCCFLPPRLNTFMTNSLKGTKGTSYHKHRGKFVIQINNPLTRKMEYLGYSTTKEEGHVVWLKRKYELLEELLKLEEDIPDLLKSKIREVFKDITLDTDHHL